MQQCYAMDFDFLDNPIWNSLATCHARFAIGGGLAKKYPVAIGPFAGVREITRAAFAELEQVIDEDEQVYLVGLEEPFPTELCVEHHAPITQMVAQDRVNIPAVNQSIITLTESDVPDMLDLIELTFPGYFRPQTYKLGTYFGIVDDGKLIAMAGERMSMTGFREISAVCTHPDYRGRGFAQHLMALLIDKLFDENITPFLHVDVDNEKAKGVYRKLGFFERKNVPLKAVSR